MMIPTTPPNGITRDTCRRARLARDAGYDGLFFSGAATTKIYCRPTCPGKPPQVSNTIYFYNRAAAEAAGYRPCLRCRPELAPGPPDVKTAPWQVRQLLGEIHRGRASGLASDGPMPSGSPLSVPERGDYPASSEIPSSQYWQTFQLGFAKMLLTDTTLSLEEIARIAKFDNARAMLAGLSALYRRDVHQHRKPIPLSPEAGSASCAVFLAYRPPFDWPALLDYFRARAIAGVEKVAQGVYQRSFALEGSRGWFAVAHVPASRAVRLEVRASDLGCLMPLVWRVRRMFDLDADPRALASVFGHDPLLGPTWSRHPGLRVPVGWDAFEFAVRAIVGQLISVAVATKLVGRIAATWGDDLGRWAPEGIDTVFPSAACLEGIDLHPLGLTRTKASAVNDLAAAVRSGRLDLDRAWELDTFIKRCTALGGIGPWTAQTIAMRGLGAADAFPASDLGIVKAISAAGYSPKPADIRRMAEGWRPWRAYAAILLWMSGS